jgi:hypothetical protein
MVPELGEKFLKAHPLPGTHLYLAGQMDNPLAVEYGLIALPTTFTIDSRGKVRRVLHGLPTDLVD